MKLWTLPVMAAALFLVVGCGGAKEGEGGGAKGGGAAAAKKDGFDSPEALFKGMLEVQKKENAGMVEFAPFMAPSGRKGMAFGLLMMGGMLAGFEQDEAKKAEMEKSFKEIQAKHKIPEKIEGMEAAMEDKAKQKELQEKIFKDVDVIAFLKDMTEWQKKYSDDKEDGMGPKVKEMKDLKIEGDKATAKMVDEKGKEDDFKFIKIDGRWYADME